MKVLPRNDVLGAHCAVQFVAGQAKRVSVDFNRKVSVIRDSVGLDALEPDSFDTRELAFVQLDPFSARTNLFVERFEDRQSECRVELGKLAIDSNAAHFVLTHDSKIAQRRNVLESGGIRPDNSAALGSVEQLRRVKAEDGEIAPVADPSPAVKHTKGMSGVIHNPEAFFIREIL